MKHYPDDLAERAQGMGLSIERAKALLSIEPYVHSYKKATKANREAAGINHHIRKHPRMLVHYIVYTINNVRTTINGAAGIEESRKIRDAHFKAIGLYVA